MRGRRAFIAFAGLVLCSLAATSWAQGAAAPRGFVRETRGQLGASINNAGAQQSFDMSWRRALSTSSNPVLADAHFSFGAMGAFTPAGARGGAWLEFAPVSVLTVRAGAEPAYYFGTFHSLMSFASAADAFDTDTRKSLGDGKSGTATRLYVTPSLQFRAGHLVGRSSLDVERWSSSSAGPFYYEPTRDTLLKVDGGRLTSLSSALLYEHGTASSSRTLVGVTHSLSRVSDAADNQIQKAGVVMIRQFGRRILGVPKPSVTLAVSRYIDDPSKRGEWSGAFAIGFSLR
jgi:hypothetical protein